MQTTHRHHWLIVTLLIALPTALLGEVSAATSAILPLANPIDRAQHQVAEYLSSLANIHCAESVTQVKLASNGHVEATRRAKYDYLIMMSGSGDDFQLNESRIDESKEVQKSSPTPMLVTNGIATLLLVFHPYYRDSFTFVPGMGEMVDGRRIIPIHFTHISGGRTPMALALRDREYPLELQGTAWIDDLTGTVTKMDAKLLGDMSDVGLRSMNIEVDYKAVSLGIANSMMALPSLATVDLETPRQHWRNTHIFGDYKSFSTGAEQDPNIKVHEESSSPDSPNSSHPRPPTPKEKP